MKIVLIGHTGLLGAEVLCQLDKEHQVVPASKSTGLDVCQPKTFSLLPEKCDLVINASGWLDCSADSFIQAVQVNSFGPLHIAQYAKNSGARLLHISSIFAIEHSDNQFFDGYGASKKTADNLLQQYAAVQDLPLTILRLPQLYDLLGRAKHSQAMLYRLIEQMVENKQATIYGTLNPQRNYMNVQDAAHLIKQCAVNSLTGLFNCPHPQTVTVYELVELIAKQLEIPPVLRLLPDKAALKNIHVPKTNLVWQALELPLIHNLQLDIADLLEHRNDW